MSIDGIIDLLNRSWTDPPAVSSCKRCGHSLISFVLIRLLHILDAQLDFQTQRAADDLLQGLGKEFCIDRVTIGAGGDFRGIADFLLRKCDAKKYDAIHSFGKNSLLAAALDKRRRIFNTPPAELAAPNLRWMRAVSAYRNIHVVCSSDQQRRRIVQRGLPMDCSSLIYPGVDLSKIKSRRNSDLRQAMRFDENDYVLLAPGESTEASNHRLALWTCAILSELDPHYKILLWSRGPKADALIAGSKSWRRSNMATFAESKLGRKLEFEQLFAAADAVLVTANEGAAVLPLAICMGGGLPIISVTNRTTSEFLEDRHTAAMVPFPRPRDLARRILDVRQDAGLQWAISDTARAECYEHFSLSRFLSQMRNLYQSDLST